MKAIFRWLETLRFPVLLLLAAVLFVVDLLTPDPLPFIDEILFALVTLLLARVRKRPKSRDETPGTNH